MKTDNTTLKDIAKIMGVSATTVHRALQGTGRVSKETREKAMKLASEMGYRSNYMAAALKKKGQKFAVALPEPTEENRYYYLNLWQGISQFMETVTEFNVEVQEFFYHLTPDANGAVLKNIYETQADNIDGVITIAVNHPQSSYFLDKLSQKGIPIALIGANLHHDFRFCCVKSYDEMAGQLAAELLTSFLPNADKKKIILTGNMIGSLTMTDQYDNSRGFEEYVTNHAPYITLLRAYNSDTSLAYNQIKELLIANPDVYAVYSCSARHTIQMCRAVTELGMDKDIKLVGNDCFAESVELLANGVLNAIIDKKIRRQSYLAIQTLFNYKMKSEYPSASVLYVQPSVVMRSNLNNEMMLDQHVHMNSGMKINEPFLRNQ